MVRPGTVVAPIGAYLLAFKVTPREPGFRAVGISVILVMAGLGVASLMF